MSKELSKEASNILMSKKRKRSVTKTQKGKKRNDPKEDKKESSEEKKELKEQEEMAKSESKEEQSSGMIVETNKESINSNIEARDTKAPDKKASRNKESIVESAIEKMQEGDPNEILPILYELSDQLSIAHESIAENPNCSTLMKELLNIFDKFNSPELSIQALTSINYLIDIYPYFCSVILKSEGVKKIVIQTQNVEYIDLAENAIKAIEKLSYDYPNVLLENDAFSSILMFVDFFDSNIKKYVVNSCYNMTRYIRKYEFYQNYITPALPSLTSLTKLSGNTDLDKSILDKAILCFQNIFAVIKSYKFYTINEDIWNSVIQYGMADNLVEIIFNFFKMMKYKEGGLPQGLINSVVSVDTFKTVIKVFQLLCEQSAKISNMLINMNIMETIYTIMKEELEMSTMSNNSLDKGRVSATHHTIFNELFPFIQSFFPDPCHNNQEDRVITDKTSEVFHLFSEKIIPLLIDNFVNISSSNLSLKVLKLINIYCYYSDGENLAAYIDPLKMANLMSKMLSSKDSSYILEIFDLIEVIMSRSAETFFVQLIREGVVDNLTQIISIQEGDLIISSTDRLSGFLNLLSMKYKDIYQQILLERNNVNSNNILNEEKMEVDEEMSEESSSSNQISEDENEDDEEDKGDEESSENDRGEILENKNEALSDVKMEEISEQKNEQQEDIKSYVDKSHDKGAEIIPSNSNIQSQPAKKLSSQEMILMIISKKAAEIFNKYFNESKSSEILTKLNILNTINDPNLIMKKLTDLAEKIKYSIEVSDDFKRELIDEFFLLIFGEHRVTFHEIEKSKIIFYFVNYLDDSFQVNLKERKNIQNTNFEHEIISKLDILFNSLHNDIEKVKQFISLLQYCISSMNCFKVCLYEYNYKNSAHLFLSAHKSQIQKYKINFNYVINEDTLNEYGIDPLYQDLHKFYTEESIKTADIDQHETFSSLEDSVLKKQHKGVPLSKSNNNFSSIPSEEVNRFNDLVNTLSNRKGSEDFENTERILTQLLERKQSVLSNYEENENTNSNLLPISLRSMNTVPRRTKYNVNFYVELSQKKFYINKKWNLNDLIKEIKHNFTKTEIGSFFNDIKIKFDISVKDDLLKVGSGRKSSTSYSLPLMKVEDSNHDIIAQNSDKNCIEEILFNKFYHQKVISNPALYSVHKVSPYLYLIALFELAINQFTGLFKFQSELKESSLENIKISSLIIKQVRDPYSISSNTVPSWCKEYSNNFNFIASFNSRYLYFKTCTFDLKRSMTNLYVYIKNFMGESISEDKTLANSRRRKITIDRENIFLSTEKLIKEAGTYTGYLEFEYFNETGSGIGPTQEFYSLFIKEILSKRKLWYKTTNLSLFPAPSLTKEIGFEENEKLFSMLGFIVARALFDDRLIDIPLSSLFWDIVLDRPVNYLKICKIDMDLGKALTDFLNLISIKKEMIDSWMNIDGEDNQKKSLENYLNEKLLYNKMKIEDIGLNFVIPGYNHIELIEDGYNTMVNANNLEEYINLIFDSICFEGIKDSVAAFKKGFNIVFPISNLNCFSSEELEDVLCGSSNEVWDHDTIYDSIRANHGYDKNSVMIKYLLEILLKLDKNERKKFLLFVTGSPRLPLGGFKNLTPKLTVVKRNPDIPNESPDKYLPTVMTCQNYLKIPEYSSFEILRSRLFTAMYEGGNSFDLS